MSKLQQHLSELQSLLDSNKLDELTIQLAKLKIELASSGLYFAPPSANAQDLVSARSILELGVFAALRQGNLKLYTSYNSALQPFYDNLSTVLPESPNRPMTLGLYLLYLLSEGELTLFHTVLEALDMAQLNDVFVKLAVDLERWTMEGQYNKVYRARDRVPRPEYTFLLARLVAQIRNQIASTVETSYASLPLKNAAQLLLFKSGEKAQLVEFAQERGWAVSPTSQIITFPLSPKADIRVAAAQFGDSPATASLDVLQGKGVTRGTPMHRMVGPSLRLAQQLEAIV